jgi:hypothetical protein
LKQEYNVMILNVQSKHNLLVQCGCETKFRFNNVRLRSSNNFVTRSPTPASARGIAAKSGQQLLPAMCASCLPLALYGSAALVKVVPPGCD